MISELLDEYYSPLTETRVREVSIHQGLRHNFQMNHETSQNGKSIMLFFITKPLEFLINENLLNLDRSLELKTAPWSNEEFITWCLSQENLDYAGKGVKILITVKLESLKSKNKDLYQSHVINYKKLRYERNIDTLVEFYHQISASD